MPAAPTVTLHSILIVRTFITLKPQEKLFGNRLVVATISTLIKISTVHNSRSRAVLYFIFGWARYISGADIIY